MNLITWNCNMAFRKKAAFLMPYEPSLVVVPECEHPDKLKFPSNIKQPTQALWFGKNVNKGLGIFSYTKLKLAVLDVHNDEYKLIVPLMVTQSRFRFILLAIWANNPADKDGPYVTQVWKAINHYEKLLRGQKTILAGDFNSNSIWDRPRRAGNHSTVVKFLAEKGIHSLYHYHHNQEQGKEKHPTHYLYRHKNKPYHLDYCFASQKMLLHLKSVQIGDFKTWCKLSDHVPIFANFKESLYAK